MLCYVRRHITSHHICKKKDRHFQYTLQPFHSNCVTKGKPLTWNMNLWWAWDGDIRKRKYLISIITPFIFSIIRKKHEKWQGNLCHPSFIGIVSRKVSGTRLKNAKRKYTDDKNNVHKLLTTFIRAGVWDEERERERERNKNEIGKLLKTHDFHILFADSEIIYSNDISSICTTLCEFMLISCISSAMSHEPWEMMTINNSQKKTQH